MPDEPTPTPPPDDPPERGGDEGAEGGDFLESLVNDPIPPVDEADETADEGSEKFLESLVQEPDPPLHAHGDDDE